MKPARSEADEARSAEERSVVPAYPPLLTGGVIPSLAAKVDWCTATWKPDPDEHIPATALSILYQVIGAVEGQAGFATSRYGHGVRFFYRLRETAIYVGRVDWEGPKGRARIDIPGAGCGVVSDWSAWQGWLGRLDQVSLTRVDLAVDCLFGQFTVDHAVTWYKAGLFKADAAGVQPRHNCIGDWLDPVYGRTLEIGRRTSGKMCRAYEKGRQLGDRHSPWNRFEVEVRNEDRELPLDILTDCDKYFAGAYKCLGQLVGVAGKRIEVDQAETEIALGRLSVHARSSYGQLIDVLRLRMTADEIIDFISRPGIPDRLTKASLAEFLTAESPAAFIREKVFHESQRNRP